MFRLSDIYTKMTLKPFPTECGLACEVIDARRAMFTSQLTESVANYSYTLIMSGSLTVSYSGKKTRLTRNDLFITTPGMMIRILSVSDDYSALSLLGDESITYDIPFARNVICASYFP